MYLVIDTATKDLGVALMDETEVAGQFHWRTRQNHSAELVPAILHLLGKADLGLHDLKGFVVSLGPGGFSGLRVGMTTAKGLPSRRVRRWWLLTRWMRRLFRLLGLARRYARCCRWGGGRWLRRLIE